MRLELLKWIKDNNVEFYNLKDLLDHSDEFIQDILNIEDEELRAFFVTRSSSADFIDEDDVVKRELLKIILDAKRKGQQFEYAKEVAVDVDVLNSDFAVELTKIVANAVGKEQAKYAKEVAVDVDVLNSDYAVELTKIVANAVGEEQAECARIVAVDFTVLNSGFAVELTKIIANAVGEEQAEYARKVAVDSTVLNSGFAVELTKIVANAVGKEQAKYAKEVAVDFTVLNSDYAVELTRIVANAIGEEQAKYAKEVTVNLDFSVRNDVVNLVQSIANEESTKKIESLFSLLSWGLYGDDKYLPKILDYLPYILDCKNDNTIIFLSVLIERMIDLDINNGCFLIEKIAQGEYLEQFVDYVENTVSIQRALENNDLDGIIASLEKHNKPDEKLNDILKNKVKRM